MPARFGLCAASFVIATLATPIPAEENAVPHPAATVASDDRSPSAPESYLLGPGDEVHVRVLDLEEIPDKAIRVDQQGDIRLPLAGPVHAAGSSISELEDQIRTKLRKYLKNPSVTLTLTEFREQPVTVLGAVHAPGIRQVRGSKDLLSVISESGGFLSDAGPLVRITRPLASGEIPLPTSHLDDTGKFFVAEVEIASLLSARYPRENIPIRPHDIVAVPPAALIYVLGEVARPGGYEVTTARTVSVLHAVAQAGGTNRNASSSRARVLRPVAGNKAERTEIVVNLDRMLAGRVNDFDLRPDDILYLPTNKGKVVTTRAIEAMVGTGSSIAVFRGSR